MTEKEQVNTRLPPDQYEAVEEYREDRGISRSEAARRLLVAGLEAEDQGDVEAELREEIADLREERGRLEAAVDTKDDEVERLEEELDAAEQEAQKWQAKYNEAVGKLKVHHSEKGAVDRVKALLFG